MKNYKFRAPPDIAIDTLPFELNEPSFNEWLGRLSFKNGYMACHKLYSVLKSLGKTDVDLRLEFTFLHAFVPVIDALAERLEYSYIDSGFPLTEEELANVEILGWTYMHLISRFSRLYQKLEAEGESWTVIDKAKTLYRSLYSADRLQLYASEVYTLVHDGFWQECYQNYLLAETSHLLNFHINEGLDHNPTIQTLFKQILIFDICDTNCFRSREIKNLYGLLKRFSDVAVIMDEPPMSQEVGVFQFDLNSDHNPKKWSLATPAGDGFSRYIYVVPVAKNLYRSLQQPTNGRNTLQSVNKSLLLKVVSMLSKGQKRKNTRFATDGNAAGFIGFNNVVSVIAKLHGKTANNLVPAPNYDPRIAGRWKEPDFDLVPLGDEIEHQLRQKQREGAIFDPKLAKILQASGQLSSDAGDWTHAVNERNRLLEEVTVGHFDVFNSSIKGYGLHWSPGSQKVKIGEIFGVEQDHGKELEVGLVRRISVQSDHSLSLGIELIGLKSDTVWLVRAGINKNKGMLAIFIPAIVVLKQPDSIVVANTQLTSGQMVVIYQENNETTCQLGHLLHTTPAINHFELVYDATE